MIGLPYYRNPIRSARVPIIAAGPDFRPGVRVSTPVDLLDLQAALFDITGNDPKEIDNVYDTQPEVAQRMEATLRRICDPEAENDRAERFIEAQLAAVGKG